jgi:hypothetical protein
LNKSTKAFLAILLVVMIAVPTTILSTKARLYDYHSASYRVKADSVIKHFEVKGLDLAAQYQVFQCEENYREGWALERFKASHVIQDTTLFAYSSLFTFDVYKVFVFTPDGWTVNLTKAYTVSGFCWNNQIIVDLKNEGFRQDGNKSFTFLEAGFTVTISVLWSNSPVSIQPPRSGNPTELQFNFDGAADRDIRYHDKGDCQTVLFDVSLGWD